MKNDTMKQTADTAFIFINSSQDRPKRRRADNFAIFSHVAKTYRARLKEERWQNLLQSTASIIAQRSLRPAILPVVENDTSQSLDLIQLESDQRQVVAWEPSRFIHGSPSTNSGRLPNTNLLRTDSGQHLLPFRDGQDAGNQQDLHPWKQCTPSPVCWKGNSDPFQTTPVALNAHRNEIIRLAQQFVIFTAWPDTAPGVFRTPVADTRNSHIRLDFATQDEGLLHAILASGNRISSKLTAASRESRVSQEYLHKARAVAICATAWVLERHLPE